MGWTFGGLAVKKEYKDGFETLLAALALKKKKTGTAFNFSTAISKQNKGTAAGIVKGHTILLDHLLPYDCSFEEGEKSRFDKTLEAFSKEADALVFMFDSVSGTYAFSLFSGGDRKRRWASEPGNVLCNEGDPLEEEIGFITGKAKRPGGASPDNEARVMTVLESFLHTGFTELLNNEKILFELFI